MIWKIMGKAASHLKFHLSTVNYYKRLFNKEEENQEYDAIRMN